MATAAPARQSWARLSPFRPEFLLAFMFRSRERFVTRCIPESRVSRTVWPCSGCSLMAVVTTSPFSSVNTA